MGTLMWRICFGLQHIVMNSNGINRIMRFVIPVVFYAITNVQCVYWSDTAIFIGTI